jgi:hypothetical protein
MANQKNLKYIQKYNSLIFTMKNAEPIRTFLKGKWKVLNNNLIRLVYKGKIHDLYTDKNVVKKKEKFTVHTLILFKDERCWHVNSNP